MNGLRLASTAVLLVFGLGIAILLGADILYTKPSAFLEAIRSPTLQDALILSLVTSAVTTLLAVAVAVPAGYALSRYPVPGALLLDTLVDATIVLPPLVMGISLLILFRLGHDLRDSPLWLARWIGTLSTQIGELFVYRRSGIVVAQFVVSAGYAFRAIKAAFDATDKRLEGVARTLGSTPLQAFWHVAIPTARPGIVAGAVLCWAKAFGLFAPVMVFAGAVRGRTEVLPTAVYLEVSIGRLDAALAISLLMIAASFVVLVVFKRLTGANVFGQPTSGG